MRLENLYSNFADQSSEEQIAFVIAYRQRRAEDMSRLVSTKVKGKKSTSGKESIIDLSDEEKTLMKALGLKKKDMIALRQLSSVEEPQAEEDEHAADIFKEDTYEEGEDDGD